MGAAADDRPDDPRDGRIVELGLPRSVDPGLGSDVEIALVARSLPAAR